MTRIYKRLALIALGAIGVIGVVRFQHTSGTEWLQLSTEDVPNTGAQRGQLARAPVIPIVITATEDRTSGVISGTSSPKPTESHSQTDSQKLPTNTSEVILREIGNIAGKDFDQLSDQTRQSLIAALINADYEGLQQISGIRVEELSAEQRAKVTALLENRFATDVQGGAERSRTINSPASSSSPYDPDKLAQQAQAIGNEDEQSAAERNAEGSRQYIEAVNSGLQ